MCNAQDHAKVLRRIRLWLGAFVIGLVLSGVTAFPLVGETGILARNCAPGLLFCDWIARVHQALVWSDARFPFLAYGTDWLAFAHLVIAMAFIGPFRDPVRNAWVIDWALICCAGVIPLALIAGQVRGIPFGWRLIDCSFGVIGAVPLLLVRRDIRRLSRFC